MEFELERLREALAAQNQTIHDLRVECQHLRVLQATTNLLQTSEQSPKALALKFVY